jgi:mxaJ protein
LLVVAGALSTSEGPTATPARVLRVCADPNNLPFSNQAGEGLENRLVQLLASELGAKVEYHWQPQRRGFVRQGLSAAECDLVPGYASAIGRVGTTRPYYRSSYMFVARERKDLPDGLDDARLHRLRVGIQLVGDDGANSPPAQALARRGIIDNVHGYTVYGDYARASPQAEIIEALRRGDIDVAIVWGPTAGYFGGQGGGAPLPMAPVQPWLDGPLLPMVYEVSVAVRKEDVGLRRELDRALQARHAEVEALLREFRVPLVP